MPSHLTRFLTAVVLTVGIAGLFGRAPAAAQAPAGCTAAPGADGNLVVRCRHVSIEIEKGADVAIGAGGVPGAVRDAAVRSGAVYIEDGGRPGTFQVRTPDAIASVRGTVWAVDVSAVRTSVFVVGGSVAVRRPRDGQAVTLGAGDGVDVASDTAALTVKRWPAERVAALLARFGR